MRFSSCPQHMTTVISTKIKGDPLGIVVVFSFALKDVLYTLMLNLYVHRICCGYIACGILICFHYLLDCKVEGKNQSSQPFCTTSVACQLHKAIPRSGKGLCCLNARDSEVAGFSSFLLPSPTSFAYLLPILLVQVDLATD